MRRLLLSVTLVGVAASGMSAAEAGTAIIPEAAAIKADRPRLLLRPNDTPCAISLTQLRAAPKSDEDRQMLARLKALKSMRALALVYLITGDTAAADRAVAAMRAWKTPDEKARANPFTACFSLLDLALAYDWLYGYEGFTDAIKADVRAKAWPLAEAGVKGGDDHLFHNYVWMRNSGAMLWAMATLGDDPKAGPMFKILRARFNDRLYPGMAYLGGVPGDAPGYWFLYCHGPGLMTLLAAQSAFETDLTRRVETDQGDWLNRQLTTLAFSALPTLRHIHWGDLQPGWDGGLTHEMAGNIDAMAWALKSPAAARLSRYVAAKRGAARFYGDTAVLYFLYTRHVTAKPADPPLAYLAGGRGGGQFYARSDWTDAATIVGFRCTDFFGSHNHFDQGSFVIYRNGPLAMDTGCYRHPRGHQQATACHNTLLFDGRGQRGLRFQWAQTLDEFKARLHHKTKPIETGEVLFHAVEKGWAAVAGQFGQAYDPKAVKSCVRQLLFVRPGTVVVVDRITPPDGASLPDVQWLLHLPGKPDAQTAGAGVVTTNNGRSWLRCRALVPGGVTPTIEAAHQTPEGGPPDRAVKAKLMDTSRAAFTYKGKGARLLVHLLEVGDGSPPAAAPAPRATVRGATVELRIGDGTFRFAGAPTWAVSLK